MTASRKGIAPSRPAVSRLAWMDEGECITDPMFSSRPIPDQLEVCYGCPVTAECAEFGARYAGGYQSDGTVYGGLTPDELVALRKRRGYTSRRLVEAPR